MRTRRYHGLLLVATDPPGGRRMLVPGCETWLHLPDVSVPLNSQRYAPGVLHPSPVARVTAFTDEPWPTWRLRTPAGTEIVHELFVPRGLPLVALSWRLRRAVPGARLSVRPFLCGRDYHALQREDPWLDTTPQTGPGTLSWQPYAGGPLVCALTNGTYRHEPHWYRGFSYSEERRRGLDDTEDLASPGELIFDLESGEAVLLLAGVADGNPFDHHTDALSVLVQLRHLERRRRSAFPTRLHRAADQDLVRRGTGTTVIAGYPWFGDWGRDTFVALRGLCLSTRRWDKAGDVLMTWAPLISEGMLPNRFPDEGGEPEYNSVDAALWFAVAAQEYLEAAPDVAPGDREALHRAVLEIVGGYAGGSRHGIRMDADGLLACGGPGIQLTWMDARVDGREITPRTGKPVEIQALWLNAVRLAAGLDDKWSAVGDLGTRSFEKKFWNQDRNCLFDVVDVDHVPGCNDPAMRPNQVLAVSGLPVGLLRGERARYVVDAVERELWTPLGIRSLAPSEPAYAGRYRGGPSERDGVYHQGTVWPWLLGPFVEAWVRVRGDTPAARREAHSRFLEPILRHLGEAGIGHVSEVADGDPPHVPGGCPFQAWSVGEALRLSRLLAAEADCVIQPTLVS